MRSPRRSGGMNVMVSSTSPSALKRIGSALILASSVASLAHCRCLATIADFERQWPVLCPDKLAGGQGNSITRPIPPTGLSPEYRCRFQSEFDPHVPGYAADKLALAADAVVGE